MTEKIIRQNLNLCRFALTSVERIQSDQENIEIEQLNVMIEQLKTWILNLKRIVDPPTIDYSPTEPYKCKTCNEKPKIITNNNTIDSTLFGFHCPFCKVKTKMYYFLSEAKNEWNTFFGTPDQ